MKEINEKTFEMNITNQLLDVSSSYIHYMTKPFLSTIMSEYEWFETLINNVIFAQGLTQAQESNEKTGGYDVSINYDSREGTARLLFLQYKAGSVQNLNSFQDKLKSLKIEFVRLAVNYHFHSPLLKAAKDGFRY